MLKRRRKVFQTSGPGDVSQSDEMPLRATEGQGSDLLTHAVAPGFLNDVLSFEGMWRSIDEIPAQLADIL